MAPARAAVVDSSVLHAYLEEGDPHHEAARRLLEAVEEWIVPMIVVHELVWSIRRRRGAAAAQAGLGHLLSSPRARLVPVERVDVENAMVDARRYQDLLVLSVARRLGLPVATLDRGMARLARRHGLELLAPPLARRG